MRPFVATICALLAGLPAAAGEFVFASIDGGEIDLADWAGKPVLVVNTASLCGFAGQFDALQALHESYGPRGVLILAVPSNDFNQELGDETAVKEYCEANFGLTMPMTEITDVTGRDAHPFYLWAARETGFTPKWNFNKILLGPDGDIAATWGAATAPGGRAIISRIEALLK